MNRLIKQGFAERREGGRERWEAKKQKQCTAPSLTYIATSMSPSLSRKRFRALVTCFLLLIVSHTLMNHAGVMSGALLYLPVEDEGLGGLLYLQLIELQLCKISFLYEFLDKYTT